MPPAGSVPDNPERGPSPADPLVPLLPLEGSAPDPVALTTWYQALDASMSLVVPHDLFALWLFPRTGGSVLLGPDALSRDQVDVPLPSPVLQQDQLFGLEQLLRKARYPSAIAVPLRHDDQDVGVMLLGAFARGSFGPTQALELHRLAAQLAGALAPLAEAMTAVTPHAAVEPAMTVEELPRHLARAAVEAASGPDLVRRVSGVLYPLLPHDRLELLAAGAAGALIPLSGSAPKRRWHGSGGTVDPFLALVSQFGQAGTLLIEDLEEIGGDSAWMVGGGAGSGQGARSVVGARLMAGGQLVGYFLLGSVARDAYRPEDEDTIALAALLIAPRVHGLRAAAEAEGLRAQAGTAEPVPRALVGAAEALAGTSHLGDALGAFDKALAELIPHDASTLHLRRGEGEVLAIDPEAPRPLADLPGIPLDRFEAAPVLLGEREWLVRSAGGGEELTVPLRVAGRIVGTLGIRARSFPATRDAAHLAQQFADVLAPHLELLRRGAAAGGPTRTATATHRS